jgi:hypothetical protein
VPVVGTFVIEEMNYLITGSARKNRFKLLPDT